MPIITENQLREIVRQPQEGLSITLPQNTRFSPAAEDFIKHWKINVVFEGCEGEKVHSGELLGDDSSAKDQKPSWLKPADFPINLSGDLPKCSVCGTPIKVKPEYMTQLNASQYSLKNTPRIRFRGKLDSLHGLMLLVIRKAKDEPAIQLAEKLSILAAYCREIASAEYNQRTAEPLVLDGLTDDDIRKATHKPEQVIGISHIIPQEDDPEILLWLNVLRCQVRETEIYALDAFEALLNDSAAHSVVKAMNRLSNAIYYLELLYKAGKLQ